MFFDNEGDQNNHQPASDTDDSSSVHHEPIENTKGGKLAMGVVAAVFATIIVGALWLLLVK